MGSSTPDTPVPDPVSPGSETGSETPSRKRRRNSGQRPTGKINYPKKRVSVACDVCRSRKTRCDAARPACSFCAHLGIVCVYRKSEASVEERSQTGRLDQSSHDGDVLSRLERIETLLARHTDNHDCVDFGLLPGVSYSIQPRGIDLTSASPASSLLMTSSEGHKNTSATVFGFHLDGLSRLADHPRPLALVPLCSEDPRLEEQLELEIRQGESLFQSGASGFDELDLRSRRCWQLQQAFSSDVLPWCPIIDHYACSGLVSGSAEGGFDPSKLETALALLILALGAFARECHHVGDDSSQLPGVDYFVSASRVIDSHRSSRYTILYVQCHILMAFYAMYSLRPFLAYEAISTASTIVIMLLQMRSRLSADPVYRELCHRAYWACYLIEHELQAYVSFSSRTLEQHHESVPLPLSDYDEPGMYWFLAEIALRRTFSSSRDGVPWADNTLYAPVVVDEVSSQMFQWHANLPELLKFPVETGESSNFPLPRPLLDPRRLFLRAQFYAVQSTLHWSYIVRLLTFPHTGSGDVSAEHAHALRSAFKSVNFGVLHLYAVEPLLQDRHLMLLPNITGMCCCMSLLLCTYGLPELASIQHPKAREAIMIGWQGLKIWQSNPGVRIKLEKIESIMRSKGILPAPSASHYQQTGDHRQHNDAISPAPYDVQLVVV